MRNREKCPIFRIEQSFPQTLLGVYIEGAREIIEYEQFGLPIQHSRSGRSLFLSARELYPLRSDHRIKAIFEFQ